MVNPFVGSTVGTRGKYAEGKVREALKKRSERQGFAFARWPDARAGSRSEAPADFSALQAGRFFLIEVKEVAHDFRLPKKNFENAQRARMRMWESCGAECYVLVFHTTTKLWRLMDMCYVEGDYEDLKSWDLQNLSTGTLADKLTEVFGR